jgi:DNA replicative helicase MCM subunit Mcm2 (Cdc46/Mcm family)
MPSEKTLIVCERCMRVTVVYINTDHQSIEDYKSCPLCGSKNISHLTKKKGT